MQAHHARHDSHRRASAPLGRRDSASARASPSKYRVFRSACTRFRAPARFDDELEITLEVEGLGNTSMVSAIWIARDGEVLAEGRIVHIFVRADRLGEKAPIPDQVRRILQPYTAEHPGSLATSTITES
jgi:acyl-CoA thioesterase FadM